MKLKYYELLNYLFYLFCNLLPNQNIELKTEKNIVLFRKSMMLSYQVVQIRSKL